MRVCVTGATGFIGLSLIPELISGGHMVLGLTRSDAGAETLQQTGIEVLRGDVNDFQLLRTVAKEADAVVHTAFNHDFSKLKEHSEEDRKVIETLGDALSGSQRPLVISSGTGMVRAKNGSPACETDPHVGSSVVPRAATEEAADALIAKGNSVIVVRMSQVHDTRRQGRISLHVELARKNGWVAYINEGSNRVPAVHLSDAVRLFRLVLEKGKAGAHYHAVHEEGIPFRVIAEAIGDRLKLPVRSISPEAAPEYFGGLARLAAAELAASSVQTRQELGWNPAGPGLLDDLRKME